MNNVCIKPLSDEPDTYHLLAGWAYDFWFAERGIEKYKVELDYKRRISGKMPMSWISYCDDIPCGMISLKEKEIAPELHLTPWLSALYVLPEFRNRGIGAKLIHSVLDFAGKNGYSSIYLFTDIRNADYLSGYYSRRGWNYHCDAKDSGGHTVKIFSNTIVHKSL